MAAAVAVGAIHVQQHVLRYRAEELLSDIRTLTLRASTFADAQKTFQRWEKWGHYDGICTEERCRIEINLNDFAYDHAEIFGGHEWLFRSYLLVGGRPAQVRASVTVRDGHVWGKGFFVAVEVPRGTEDGPHVSSYTLIGEAHSVSNFSRGRAWPELDLHPNYVVGRPGGCSVCLMVYARFTPYAPAEEVTRLMQFNLSCLTRWRPCREHGDIMPAAWSEYLAERREVELTWQRRQECTSNEVQRLARDTESAALVEVVQNQRQQREDEVFQLLTLRLVRRLKRAVFWEPETTRQTLVSKENLASTKDNDPAALRPGSRFIILFDHHDWQGVKGMDVELDQCGVIPASEENLDRVSEGILQDFLAAHPDEERPGSGQAAP